MYSLTTDYDNTLDFADSVLNSLEIKSPFISFRNDKLGYTVSYYFDNKALIADCADDNSIIGPLISRYWYGENGAAAQVAEILAYQACIDDIGTMPEEYFTKAADTILAAMDGFSKAVEGLAS